MPANEQILIIDDDVALREFLAGQLELHQDFVVVGTATGQEARKLLQNQQFAMILMDVSLPDIDGRDLCRIMRRQGVKIPIIMLTALNTDADLILGLDSGANDYVTKPFHLGVLLARVRAHHRHFKLCDDAHFAIGPYSFRPSTKILTEKATDRKIHLTEKETALLKFLYRIGDQPAPRQTLLDEVWGYKSDVSSHTIETHIYRLRQKIEPDPSRAKFLVTDSQGYRLAR